MVQMEKKKPNRLVKEKSPYLLQHAYNPVDWYPWGDEALERAAREEKPIFLSIGYSTCHWCHVMEKDSFEDPEVAAIINEHFVPIKVDREERPDLDQKYMAACQALTGQGGWPLTVFLTPEGKPFYAGTFFPKNARYGINGLMEILPRLSTYWKDDRERVINAADELVEALKEVGRALHRESSDNNWELPGTDLLEKAYLSLKQSFDQENGGFGGAPKFPAPHQLIFLLRYAAKTGSAEAGRMAIETLRAIHRGGIFDQLGYGLHRYSVDSRWHIPHFEKMLYDQAMIALAAVEAYRYSGDAEMSCFARKTFSYVLENLTSPDGAFYSAEDADSEGEEGKFYVWKAEEVLALLGPEKGRLFNAYYGVTDEGNFEKGNNVFYRGKEDASFAASEGISAGELDQILEEARLKLSERRSSRIRPFLDDKIITSWNALQIAALAAGGRAFEERSFLEAAERAARFIIDKMLDSDGILYRRYRDGERAIPGFLDDYAYMVWALLELYRVTVKTDYLELAKKLNSRMLELFYIREGMLSFSAHDQKDDQNMLEAEAYDGAMPSGLSVAAMNMLQLGRICLDENLREKGKELIIAQRRQIEKYPTGYTYLLAALQEAILPNAGPAYCTADGNCGLE